MGSLHDIKLRTFGTLFVSFVLVACGGSSPPTQAITPVAESPPEEATEIFIGLTDAEGEFLEYQVEVTSIALTRANGVLVETLPLSTMVDFAQYTEVTEFVTAATVPTGRYRSASLTLNYENALIQVEDANGDPVEAVAVDENGDPVGVVEIAVEFADFDGFRIAPGIPAHITLDFDLESSHEVNFNVTPVEVTLDGVLLADTILEDPKTRRARGLLGEVDVATSQFDLELRPFYRPNGRFGTLPVTVDEDTGYEINGVEYAGAEGLRVLAAEPLNTPVITSGKLNIAERQYLATVVYAGSSVPFGDKDIATGTVLSRDGDQLVLRGVVLVDTSHHFRRVRHLQVLISSETAVTQVKSSLPEYGPADISVGQRVTVIGDLERNTTGDVVQLNATEGHARMLFSQVHGIVSEAGPLVVDVANINRIRPFKFDFSGTGNGEDADPDNYEIDTGALPLIGIDINDAVKIRGFVAPFGMAPNDFLAQSLGDVSTLPGNSWAHWTPENRDGILISAGNDGLVLDISGSQRAIHKFSGGIIFDMTAAGEMWSISPRTSNRGVFAIITRDSRQVFTHFDEFIDALLLQLNDAQEIIRVRTKDVLDPQSLSSTATHLVIYLN